MQYVALLRGINVGGNTMIKMADLKKAFEQLNFDNVCTYINSGNVLFESDRKHIEEITGMIEKLLAKTFAYNAKVVVLSLEQLKEVIEEIPEEWKKDHDLRCYIAFVKDHVTPKQVTEEIDAKEGVDFVQTGKHAVYLSTKLDGLTKSGFTKLIAKKIYQDTTMRNYNTVQKLLFLMQR